MLDFEQIQTHKDTDFLERRAEALVSEWHLETKQEQRKKQMLLFRKSS
jgi:hypothetical protein